MVSDKSENTSINPLQRLRCSVPTTYLLLLLLHPRSWNDNEVLFGTAQDVELTAEFDQLEAWIADVKKIIDVELHEKGKTK